MPIKFDFADPAGQGNLGLSTTLEGALAAITGFTSYFNADDADQPGVDGVTSWSASAGTGVLSQANAARRPGDATRDGQRVLSFDGTHVLTLSGVTLGAAVTDFTIAARFYQRDHTTDVQQILGQDLSAPVFRLTSRFANSAHYYRLDSEADIDVPLSSADGWHDVILCVGGGQIKMSVDNSNFVSGTQASMNLPTFHIGGTRDTTGDALIDLRGLMLFSTDVSANATDLQTLRDSMAAL